MDMNGRPNHIEDYLITVRTGQWFGWSDSKNKIYANLIVHDGGSKPTESVVNAKLVELQDAWDAENDSYKSKRRSEYKSVADQLDQLYHDMTAGKLDGTGEWHKAIKAIKDKHAKS
tara:strand:+ start:138 stop:485 length:348 start_codon:yes stop_codon:yes gene_type:complete